MAEMNSRLDLVKMQQAQISTSHKYIRKAILQSATGLTWMWVKARIIAREDIELLDSKHTKV